MADRTVRAIFEARVSGAQKGMRDLARDVKAAGRTTGDLTKDLKTLDGLKVSPDVDVQIGDAKQRVGDLRLQLADLKGMEASPEVDLKIEETTRQIADVRAELKSLNDSKTEVKIDAATKDAKKRLAEIQVDLGELRTMDATPEVRADVATAQRALRDVRAELRDLAGAKAQLRVTADTDNVKAELAELGSVGEDVGDEVGGGVASGILDALQTIPLAGAILGVGVAIAGGLVAGIRKGLSIEAGRDLFSARTGLDEATSAKFGRAAGNAYAQAWGDSVEANLDTARVALEQGLIDADAVDADVQRVIESLSGISEVMEEDIPGAARAAGQLIKTGLVKNADQAFDVLISGFQAGAGASDDLIDTLVEYPTHFRDLGLSAEDAVGLLIQGMDEGAFNTDKVADALKELTIKVKELDTTAAPALQKLGLNGQEMSRAFSEGGPAARAALDEILTALASVEDPAERSRLAVQLFGTQAEDMAAALAGLNLDTAASELEQFGGSAGSAGRALDTLADNTASQMERARRSVETAMDGIAGALAVAFADELGGLSDWVASNRRAILEFGLDFINIVFDMASSSVDFAATFTRVMGNAAGAMVPFVEALAGMAGVYGELTGNDDMKQMALDILSGADGMREFAGESEGMADALEKNLGGALDDTRDKVNSWAAPELIAASIHDAIVRAEGRLGELSNAIDNTGGTVKINGDETDARGVLDAIVRNIDTSDGTVTINGDKVPAAEALDRVLRDVNAGEGTIEIGADTAEAKRKADEAKRYADGRRAAIKASADTSEAEKRLNRAARDRTAYVKLKVTGDNLNGSYRSGGGWIEGRAAGGWVPGPTPAPGVDNVLWPLATGGRVLDQPLAGGEFVMNTQSAREWAPFLEAINGGLKPSDLAKGVGGAGASGPQINVTNHYPQAEPTSLTVNRGLQYAAAMGVI